ncbi:MAG TPA: hypothetical protein VMX16_01580 [Terriglobia bacterium]|nr:hypothetical protein [Terriglobia bacterium]
MDKYNIKPPKAGKGDIAHTAARTTVSAVPYVGGAAVEILNMIVEPPLNKRLQEWRESIAEAIEELQQRVEGLTPENLQDNPAFISTVAYATQAAIRTHQEAKREALRNAVLNTAAGNELDEDLPLMFVNLVDNFSRFHLQLLRYFNDRVSLPVEHFPILQESPQLFDQVVKELWDRGLIAMGQGTVPRTPEAFYEKNLHSGHLVFRGQITSLGGRFIRFISSPITQR